MRKVVLFLLISLLYFSEGWGEETLQLYLGADFLFGSRETKRVGFGEFHWGGISDILLGKIVIGVSSKSFLSSAQLKDPDAVKILDNLVQSESELHIGMAGDIIAYHKEWEYEETLQQRLNYASVIVGGPNVGPGWGVGARIETITNFIDKKTEKDPSSFVVGALYLTSHIVSKLVAIYPMIGFGINEGLNNNFVYLVGNEPKREPWSRQLRLKLRADISSRRRISLYGSTGHIFLSFQYEIPFEKYGTLQLEDGTLVEGAPRLKDFSARIGICIEL